MILPLVLSIVSIILTSITAIFSVLAYARVVGMEKSTHQIQWMPVDAPTLSEDNKDPTKQDPRVKQMMKDFKQHMYPDVEDEMV